MEETPAPTPPPTPTPAKKKINIKRLALWIGVPLLAVIVLLLVLSPLIVRAILRHEIQSAVAGNLNATLEIDQLSWNPLLSVTIGHARLSTPGPDGAPVPIADLADLQVSLAKIPLGGPIVIEKFSLIDPVIDLVRLPSGELQIQQNLLRPRPPSPASPYEKPSDMIRVQHFALNNLTVRLQDFKSSAPPVTIAKLDVQADLASDPGNYNFHVSLVNKPLTDLTLDGSADVDGTTLKFKTFSFTGQVPTDAEMANWPPQIQTLLKQYALPGSGIAVSVADGASATVDMSKSRWLVHGLSGDIKLSSPNPAAAGGLIHFHVNGGGPLPGLGVPDGMGYLKVLDKDTLLAINVDQSDKVRLISPLLPHPIADGVGSLQFSDGKLAITGVDLRYGPQPIQLESSAQVLPDKITLQSFHLDVAHGNLIINSGEVSLNAPYNCSADLNYNQIQLAELKTILPISDPGGHISGNTTGQLTVSGPIAQPNVSPLQSLQGSGNTQVHEGDFWDIPVLADVVGKVVPDMSNVSRIGDAKATYTFKNGTLNLSQMAVGCPIVGVQGSGDVGLVGDNVLNLTLTVVPFGDMKKQLDKSGIPLLGQAIGDAQKAISQVQKALYGFAVTGPAAHPSIKPVPSPGISAASSDIFGPMLKSVSGDKSSNGNGGGNNNDKSNGILNFFKKK